MSSIQSALKKQFDKHRIVFWYDVNRDMREEYESVSIPGVEKLEIRNDEYGLKHRLLKEQSEQKFLLFHEGPRPEDAENWLLDVLLAQGEFRADRISIWLSELGMGIEFWDLFQEHEAFFGAVARRGRLHSILADDDSHADVRRKMMAVCAGCADDPQLETIFLQLLEAEAEGKDEYIRLIERASLAEAFWNLVARQFHYAPSEPSVLDFAIEAFKASYVMDLGEASDLAHDTKVFLNRWKDSQRYREAFEYFSTKAADILGIERDLQHRELEDLKTVDWFELIDRKILSDLCRRVVEQTIPSEACEGLIWGRRTTHWYGRHAATYEAICHGSSFLAALQKVDLDVRSPADGFNKYVRAWHALDSAYRKFVYYMRASGQVSLLEDLFTKVENLYSNKYLLRVNTHWQDKLDSLSVWELDGVPSQGAFFERWVDPYRRSEVKIGVLISDAMRYEIAHELLQLILQEDRYEAELEAMLGCVPSYTQLGMASLLPHSELTIQPDGTVDVDGHSATGTENRSKILAAAVSEPALALQAEDLLSLNREEARALIRDHQIIYIFHNQIDAVGDKRDTEERVFDAVEDGLRELIEIMKKLYNANLSNLLITTDHGFIYQHQPLDESEFAGVAIEGDDIWYRDRRFVIGRGLIESKSAMLFSAEQAGLSGDYQLAIPNSINRFRQKGAGSRYVHGGASLQEVVVPVLKVNKKRVSDVSNIDVDIIRSSTNVITSGQLAVALYQVDPVSPKLQGRTLRAGMYSQSGQLISDTHELVFDLTSGDARDREVKVQFLLTKDAEDYNGQDVFLTLEEPVPGTSQYKEYLRRRYTLRRSFSSDFDL